MKVYIYIIFSFLFMQFVYANVVISEVYYDPINSESDGELIELYNDGNLDVDLSNYVIATRSSARDLVFPSAAVIKAKGYFVVADEGYGINKDNPSWPNADYEEDITLANSDAGVALIYQNTTIDAVGWGNTLVYFEGTPTNITPEGKSIKRIKDTNNNINDFIIGTPDLKNSRGNNTELILRIIVSNSNKLSSFIIKLDDDNINPGIQIMPNPGGYKEVPVEVKLSSIAAGYLYINFLGENFNLTKIDATTYTGSFKIYYTKTAGTYTATLKLSDSSEQSSASFEYLEMTALEIDSSNINCTAQTGNSCDLIGDTNMLTKDKITIKNSGNTPIDVGVKGSTLTNGQDMIPLSSVEYNFLESLTSTKPLTNSLEINNIDISSSGTKPFSMRVNVPANAQSGTYNGAISLVAIKS